MTSSSSLLKNVPEFIETDLSECLYARSEGMASFKELGPPDLVHLSKSSGRPGQKDTGSYHFVTGVDASSSASLAAYLNTLTYALGEGKYSGKSTGTAGWRISTGVYCCYNALSRVDMRVEVKFPGKTETYFVDERGQKKDNPPAELWLETYLCATVRALLYSDDPHYRLNGWRKLQPLPDIDAENRFLDAAARLFEAGWQLGSDPDVQIATTVTNHLCSALHEYFSYSGRWTSAINFFEKLRPTHPQVVSLLVRIYVEADEEIKAIELLTDSLLEDPLDHVLLDVECDLLMKKERYDLALQVAQRAVNCAPSEFQSWARLTEVYIALDQYEQALLTLNSCPMFTYYDKDSYRIPAARTASFPIPAEANDEEILNDTLSTGSETADQNLLRLPAPALRGTFSRAYALLAKLANKIGWDELLRARSLVFVMEEEYRSQRAGAPKEEAEQEPSMTHDTETTTPSETGVTPAESESMQAPPAAVTAPKHDTSDGADDTVIASSEDKLTNGKSDDEPSHERNGASHPFDNKRLCERWLDNLFMVLYEDLRVYTVWRAEVNHFRSQNLVYRKSALEWEIFGELSLRLHHLPEAEEALLQCVGQQFSSRAWRGLLNAYLAKNEIDNALTCVVKLTTYNWRWYADFSPLLFKSARNLVDQDGLVKVQNLIAAKPLPKQALDLMNKYFSFCRTFDVEGARAG
ncbi:bud site selection protein [Savitreella phatthalungensis]